MIFARWVLYTSALGVIGAFGATLLSFPAHPRVVAVGKRLPLGLLLGGFLLISSQLYAWFGIDGFTEIENVKTMLSITQWGLHWLWLAGVAVTVTLALPLSARWPSSWIFVSGFSALGIVAVAPLVGHGGTHDQWLLLAHEIHLFGAGLWIGSLGVALLSGMGHTDELLTRLRRFAPYALTGAGLIAVSGGVLAWKHVQPFSVIWTTTYGRILIAKVVGALIVASLGFVNWRGPRVRIVIAEVLVAVLVVLSLTAWLSEVEMPMKH